MDQLPQSSYLKIQALKGVKYERLPKGRSLTAKEAAGLLKACDDGHKPRKRICSICFNAWLRSEKGRMRPVGDEKLGLYQQILLLYR